MQRWLRNRTRAGTCAQLTPRLPDSLGADAMAIAPCPRRVWRRGRGGSKAGGRQWRKGWNRHEPLEQIPRSFPMHRGIARSLHVPGKRHLRVGKVVSTNCLFFPPHFPSKRWGCLEGSTSYFPASRVQTTKPLSCSLTGALREHV